MADVRAGRGALGHFGIAKLLVFLWRLTSFPVVAGTPVAVAGCAGQYVFDPTGRQVPLFLPPAPDLGDRAAPILPREWQVPGRLTSSLEAAIIARDPAPALPRLRPGSLRSAARQLVAIWPEIGRFATTAAPGQPLTVSYQYGFSSMIGAGPYDRGLLPDPPATRGPERRDRRDGPGRGAAGAGTTGTVTLSDSLTYPALAAIGSSAAPIVSLLVRAGPGMRPVLRPATGVGPWIFTGGGEARLVLDGLTVSGCDIVLRGSFDTVRITACTIDPGTAAAQAPRRSPRPSTAAPRPVPDLRGSRSRCPGRAGPPALVDHMHPRPGPHPVRWVGRDAHDHRQHRPGPPGDGRQRLHRRGRIRPVLLASGLLSADPLSAGAAGRPAGDGRAADLRTYAGRPLASQLSGLPRTVLDGLNALVSGPSLYDPALFATVDLSPDGAGARGAEPRRCPGPASSRR